MVASAVVAALLTSCLPAEGVREGEKVYFNLEGFLEQQIDTLSVSEHTITKTIHFNGEREQQEYTTGQQPQGAFPLETLHSYVRWQKELRPFLDAGINKPALLDSYTGDTSRSASGTIDSIVYRARRKGLKTRELSVNFSQNSQVEKVQLHLLTDNPLYRSEQFLTFRPGIGYTIKGLQEVRFFEKDEFEIEVRW